MAKRKDNMDEFDGVLAPDGAEEYIIEPDNVINGAIINESKIEDNKDDKDNKIAVAIEPQKRSGRVLCHLKDSTIVDTGNGHVTVPGRIGKKGRIVEF